MENLSQDVQRTIRALEKLGANAASEQLDEWLDSLFQQKMDLGKARINPNAPATQQAAQAMRQAASKAEQALKNPARAGELGKALEDAIGKLARALNDSSTID